MIKQFFNTMINEKRWAMLALMIVSSMFCVIMIYYRMEHTGHGYYRFLNWNLFLAWIPFGVSTLLWIFRDELSNWMIWGGIALWLLFFPNSPYILTDLFHLEPKESVPYWFDLVLILSFAWTGMMLGLLSLLDIHNLIAQKTKPWMSWFFVMGFVGLAAFGIYLGRYLRFNSWDLITNPGSLFHEITDRLIHPLSYGTTYRVSLLFFVFLMLAYLTLRVLRKERVTNG